MDPGSLDRRDIRSFSRWLTVQKLGMSVNNIAMLIYNWTQLEMVKDLGTNKAAQAPCPCGAVDDDKGSLVTHQRPTNKMCLRNPKRMRTAEPVVEEPTKRVTVKVNIDTMLNCDTDFGMTEQANG
ncbi:hypothetical protein V1509DRAFT_612580 [Lipomyces kononenkoae]